MEMFETHHNVENGFKNTKFVGKKEFFEFYRFLGATIDQDKYFQNLVTHTWNADIRRDFEEGEMGAGGLNQPAIMNSSKDQWKYDFHRSLFGALDNSPMKHPTKESDANSRKPVTTEMPAAGVGSWGEVKKGVIESSASMGEEVAPERSLAEQELIDMFRERLVTRGARGVFGIKRTFKIMDDDHSKSLDFEEFNKGLNDYRVKLNTAEVRRLFGVFDVNKDGKVNYDEFMRAVVVSDI
jgi:hypothetical protein